VKISTRWLARHVDTSGLSAKDIAEGLTLSTAEVEGVERFLPHLSDVVVGAVLDRAKHPDADKLSVCKVDAGGPEILQIVCGAANVAAGQRVAVARVGTKLPGDVVIKKAKIRGVESQGMICSERELGLGDEHAGIWVLPPDLQIGRPVAEALGFDDWTIEIDNKSLTHRPDLWGHRGFATEVAAIFERKLLPLDAPTPAYGRAAPFPVRIESPACARYMAVPIDGVRTRRSPDWLRALLLVVGQRPIDLLVDLSNFVMLDLGQPNHVFDRARLSPEGIVVRMARAGETTRTLDGVERKLASDDLLICSGTEPVALAGVMGGEGSKVAPDTISLLLEVASFHPATVRRTAQRLGLRTDSSARFEKSLSPTLPPLAANRFLALLRELEPGLVLPAPPTDVGAWKDPARTIRLRGDRVRKLLGVEIDDAEIAGILRRLGLGVEPKEGVFQVCVPSVRATKDLTIEQDLVEEIGRIHRYGRIPERALVGEVRPLPRDEGVERRLLVRAIQDALGGGARMRETLSYSFLPDALIEIVGLGAEPHVQVVNPAAEGSSRIRRHVLPSLLATLAENRRRRGEVRMFEVGKGYLPTAIGGTQPTEVHLCALAWALPASNSRRFDADPVVRAKGAIEDLLRGAGFPAPTWDAAAAGEIAPWSAPGRCIVARLPGDPEPAATLCALDPVVARKLGLAGELTSDVACAEISIDRLLETPRQPPAYVPIPRLPSVEVDVAVAIPLEVRAASVVEAIGKAGKGWVRATAIFDVYQGASLGDARKSLAFHVTLAAEGRTLTDQDVAKFLERLARETEAFGGELRRS
jgi:phenylalanyl-tRNA synthetase beta chain